MAGYVGNTRLEVLKPHGEHGTRETRCAGILPMQRQADLHYLCYYKIL